MKYFKNIGKQSSYYYAVEGSNKITTISVATYANPGDVALNSFTVEQWDVAHGTADLLGIKAITKYEELSVKDWNSVKKQALEFIKQAGA